MNSLIYRYIYNHIVDAVYMGGEHRYPGWINASDPLLSTPLLDLLAALNFGNHRYPGAQPPLAPPPPPNHPTPYVPHPQWRAAADGTERSTLTGVMAPPRRMGAVLPWHRRLDWQLVGLEARHLRGSCQLQPIP